MFNSSPVSTQGCIASVFTPSGRVCVSKNDTVVGHRINIISLQPKQALWWDHLSAAAHTYCQKKMWRRAKSITEDSERSGVARGFVLFFEKLFQSRNQGYLFFFLWICCDIILITNLMFSLFFNPKWFEYIQRNSSPKKWKAAEHLLSLRPCKM